MEAHIQGNVEAGTKIDFVPPWERADIFPEKPQGKDYGYVLRGKFVECSRDELIEKCRSRDLPQVNLVWCPEHLRITPAIEIEYLHEALRERARYELKSSVVVGSISCLFWGALTLLSARGYQSIVWMIFLLTALGVIPLLNGVLGLQKLKRASWAKGEQIIIIGRYGAWVSSQRILFTWLLLGGITGIFLLECIHGFPESAKSAGLVKTAVWHGEWWRLFTAPLLHGNVMHFLFNATALIGLGRLMEVLTSRYYLALVFMVAALSGSIFSLFLLPDETSVGASGGLLGLIGFLTILGIKRQQFLPPGFAKSMAINVALLAIMGIAAFSIIDNAAHLGGFVAGIILGLLLVNDGNPFVPFKTKTNVKIAGVLILMTTLSFAGFSIVRIFPK